MTYLFVGAGQAGGAIVDAIFEYTDDSMLGLFESTDISTLGRPLVFNSTMRDLQNLSNVPEEDQYGVAKDHGLIQGTEPGFEEMVTGGFGRNPVDADEVMSEHTDQLQAILDERFGSGGLDLDLEDEDENEDDGASAVENSDNIQFAFLFLGLGGGTGCGIGPHLAQQIKEFTDGSTHVVAVAVLPNTRGTGEDDSDETNAGRQAWNARYGLDRLEDAVDGIVLVDNQRISYLDSAGGEFGEYNEYVATAIHDMVAGPMLSSVDASQVDGVDTPDIDVRDIMTSLSFGIGNDESEPGYGAIGRSVTMTKSLTGYLMPFFGNREIDSAALSRLSASKQTLARADAGDAQKAISLVRAPSGNLTAGANSVEIGTVKEYLERSCSLNEVNIGVALSDRNLASVTTLLTYQREDLDRLDEIERAADAYEEETEELLT
ncbi:cell division protein FtsZ [Natronoarchaeum rubrum]|uniref:cell division protein FtsZ n=1 Tax=Natronoarchaeum rubrum TaxID=755311 RepID=UPI002112ADF3|nr:cell division protein FtsZ [Natronoarchaeum rubrum]